MTNDRPAPAISGAPATAGYFIPLYLLQLCVSRLAIMAGRGWHEWYYSPFLSGSGYSFLNALNTA